MGSLKTISNIEESISVLNRKIKEQNKSLEFLRNRIEILENVTLGTSGREIE